jgi:hypothetical protein
MVKGVVYLATSYTPTINSFGASKIRGSPLLANAADSTINFFRSAVVRQ